MSTYLHIQRAAIPGSNRCREWRKGLILSLGCIVMAVLVLTAGPASAAVKLAGSFRGDAYGAAANATAGPLALTLGRAAVTYCPCYGTFGQTLQNTVASLSSGDGIILDTGAVTSTVHTEKMATSALVRNTSEVLSVSLLGGLITADGITAVARTSANSESIWQSSNGSKLVNLMVAGNPVAEIVAPNTQIALPGVGHVLLNHIAKPNRSADFKTLVVEMVTVVIDTSNSFGLPVGSRIVVGHAKSGYSRVQPEANFGGQAYATYAKAKAGSVLETELATRTALVSIGCVGTGGVTVSNSIAGVSVSGIVEVGAGTTTKYADTQGAVSTARTTAEVVDIGLLGGLISADSIKAVAQETYEGGIRTGSTNGTQFATLRVLGFPVLNVSPNTRIVLPGIGYVIFNEQRFPANPGSRRGAVVVNGIHIHVSEINLLGLDVGTEIIVAHASSKATRF